MTLSPLERHTRRRHRRREEVSRWGLRLAIVLIVFGLGIALGEAIHDNPNPGPAVTFDRTISLPSVPPGSTITPP